MDISKCKKVHLVRQLAAISFMFFLVYFGSCNSTFLPKFHLRDRENAKKETNNELDVKEVLNLNFQKHIYFGMFPFWLFLQFTGILRVLEEKSLDFPAYFIQNSFKFYQYECNFEEKT